MKILSKKKLLKRYDLYIICLAVSNLFTPNIVSFILANKMLCSSILSICSVSLLQPQKNEENSEKTSSAVARPITEVATDRKEEIVEKTDSKSAEIKPKSESGKHGKQEEGTSDAPKKEETVDKELLQVENLL